MNNDALDTPPRDKRDVALDIALDALNSICRDPRDPIHFASAALRRIETILGAAAIFGAKR